MLGYHIYRGDDNQLSHAERISVNMICAQNVSSESSYQYQDSSVDTDTDYYYWLQTAEMDASIAYYGPVYVRTKNIEEDVNVTLKKTKIHNAYPNPFNPSTTISFDIAAQDNIKIDIYNVKGQLIKNLVNQVYSPCAYSIIWDGNDNDGTQCSTGVYFYTMTSSGY
jgi:hypothetical protein